MGCSVRRPNRHERGVALLIVLMVTTVLTVLVLDLHQSVRIQFYIAGNLADGVKAEYLTRSGVQVAAGALLADGEDNSSDHMHEDWYDFLGKLGMPMMPAGDGNVMIDIADEMSRFNLNSLVDRQGNVRAEQLEIFKNLLSELEIDTTLANAVVDWLDSNEDAVDGSGPEDTVYGYSASPTGVLSKNAYFDSLQEIRLVYGITDEVWQKLEPLVTVYGEVKMNLNTADAKLLKAVLKYDDANADTTVIDQLVTWREESGSDAMNEATPKPDEKDNELAMGFTSGEGNHFTTKNMTKVLTGEIGFDPALARKFAKHFTVSSRYFRVNCIAIVGNVQKSALGIVNRLSKKVKIIYYRVAPGISAEAKKELQENTGAGNGGTTSGITTGENYGE